MKNLRALEDMQGLAPHSSVWTASNNKYNIKETTVPLVIIQNDLAISNDCPPSSHIYLSKEKADTLRDLDAVGTPYLALRGDIIPGVELLKDLDMPLI